MFREFRSVRTAQRLRRRTAEGARLSVLLELLETRTLLSATVSVQASQITAAPSVQPLSSVTNTVPQGYTPSQIQQAYGFNGITFSNGTIQGNGAGQTIAIVEAYNDPNLASDLQNFDQAFGLSNPPSLTVEGQSGGAVPNAVDAGWSMETALDVEWAHAMAPGAKILVVEASSSSLNDLLTTVNTARNAAGVSVVSMSWGTTEFMGESQYDSYFTTPAGHTPVTFVAASGDVSATTTWPAVSPNVLSVGGTALSLSAADTISTETGWSDTGGGVSSFESEPSYQSGVQSTGARTSPDVAYDADPNTGFAVYDSVPYAGQSGWFEVGGTSAGAPQWSAIVAIADQGRAIAGQAAISSAAAAVYGLPSSDFHDVTSGSNGYSATTGYDLVTGLGTPNANLVVNSLVNAASTSQTTATTTTTQSDVATTRTHRHEMTPQPPSTGSNSPSSPSTPPVFIVVTNPAPAPFATAGVSTASVVTQIASASGAATPAFVSAGVPYGLTRDGSGIRDIQYGSSEPASLFAAGVDKASLVAEEIRSVDLPAANATLSADQEALGRKILSSAEDLLLKMWNAAMLPSSSTIVGGSAEAAAIGNGIEVIVHRTASPLAANGEGESSLQHGLALLVSGLMAGGIGIWSVRRSGWAHKCAAYVRFPFSGGRARPDKSA